MDDKLKVFWNLDVLVKMSRSKSDGPSLRVEESELTDKIKSHKQEIEEIKSISEEDIYDSSAEMADRNIEIITKKQLQVLKNELKEKNKTLNELKEEEKRLYEQTSLLRNNKSSQEKYIASMQERVSESSNSEVIDRYNGLIAETSEKVLTLQSELDMQSISYEGVQKEIVTITEEISELEDKIDKKKRLLEETQANLENKENYIDKSKKEKSAKRIYELNDKIRKIEQRLDEIHMDPKYLESKIKDVINTKSDINKVKPFLAELLNQVIKVPYINVPLNNVLEEELLRATQARDSYANEIEQKSYNILEANTPEKMRIEFLNSRIEKWQEDLDKLKIKIDSIDKDNQFDYEHKNVVLADMIKSMRKDLVEFQKAYEDTPESNIGMKSSLKAALEEKKNDINEAEKIATLFKIDEAEDIASATRTIKYECEELNRNIQNAMVEINAIKNRLMTKKSGLIDISTRNKDKDILKELAQIVVDIKHRRQFPETPIDIAKRLEQDLSIEIIDRLDLDYINKTSQIIVKNYDEYSNPTRYNQVEEFEDIEQLVEEDTKRGVKVISETEIVNPNNLKEEFNTTALEEEPALIDIVEQMNNDENADKVLEPTENTREDEAIISLDEIASEEETTSEEDDNQEELSIKSYFESENNDEEEREPENNEESTEESDDEDEDEEDIDSELDRYINSLDN